MWNLVVISLVLVFPARVLTLCRASNVHLSSEPVKKTMGSGTGIVTEPYPPYYSQSFTNFEFYRKAGFQSKNGFKLIRGKSLNFGIVIVGQRKYRYLKLFNPTPVPLLIQAFLLPETRTVDSYSQSAPSFFVDKELDDEEFDHSYYQTAMEWEEVGEINTATLTHPPRLESFVGDWELTRKLRVCIWNQDFKCLGTEAQVKNIHQESICTDECDLQDNEGSGRLSESRNLSQAFFLPSKARTLQIIPPYSSIVLGPIVYQPPTLRNYTCTLLIRNNLTVYESLELIGQTQFPRLAFEAVPQPINFLEEAGTELNKLTYELTAEDLTFGLIPHSGPDSMTFSRNYQVKNVGNGVVYIKQLLLDGYSCSKKGVTIQNCREPMLLGPMDSLILNVTYQPSTLEFEIDFQLWVVTDVSAFYVPLHVDVSIATMFVLSDLSKDCFLSRFCVSLVLIIAFSYFGLFTHDILAIAIKGKKRVIISQRPIRLSIVSDLCHIRLRSPNIRYPPQCDCDSPIQEDGNCTVSVQITPREESKPEPKPRKIKKQKSAIMKFSPAPLVPVLKEPSSEVIATNKLLKKRMNKPQDQGVEESDGERVVESRDSMTTAHTEEDIDVFLDDYKTRPSLFSGFSYSGLMS